MVMGSHVQAGKFSLTEVLSEKSDPEGKRLLEESNLMMLAESKKGVSFPKKKLALKARKTIVKKSKGKRGRAK